MILNERVSNCRDAWHNKFTILIRQRSQHAVYRRSQQSNEPSFQTRTRTNTNPNDTEANAAGRSVRACVARKSKSSFQVLTLPQNNWHKVFLSAWGILNLHLSQRYTGTRSEDFGPWLFYSFGTTCGLSVGPIHYLAMKVKLCVTHG